MEAFRRRRFTRRSFIATSAGAGAAAFARLGTCPDTVLYQ